MTKNTNILRAVNTIDKQTSIAIVLPEKPSFDSILSGVALYLSLLRMNKSVCISCSSDIPKEVSTFKGVEKITRQLGTGGDNLVISFPYEEGSVDKITHDIEDQMFRLIITPREGFPKLDPSDVRYSYSGAKIGLIITIDAPTFQSLGALYTSNESQFKGKDIINIDRHLTNMNFGTINVVEKQSSSLSEIIYRVIEALGIEPDKDISTALYSGIVNSTNNFTSYSVNAETFEVSSRLLKSGAIKKPLLKQSQSSGSLRPTILRQSFDSPSYKYPTASVSRPVSKPSYELYDDYEDEQEDFIDYDSPEPESIVQKNVKRPFVQPKKQSGVIESSNTQKIKNIENKEPMTQEDAPSEWLKPKIFKGGRGMV